MGSVYRSQNVDSWNEDLREDIKFELHRAEEDTLVNRILELAGFIINKPGLVQLAQQEDVQEQGG